MLKRKKKYLAVLTAVVASGTLLVTTALAASSNVSGFEQIKQAALHLNAMENGTIDFHAELSENGETIIRSTLAEKVADKENSNSIFTIQVGDSVLNSIESLQQDGKCYIQNGDDDTYYITPMNTSHTMTEKETKLLNLLMDMVAGDTRNYFRSENGNISLQLKGNQIPELAQLFLSVASESGNFGVHDTFTNNSIANKIDLVADALVEDISLDATLDNNDFVETLVASMTISGSDSNGIYRKYVATCNLTVSNVGTTTVDPVDMTDKNVTEFDEHVVRRFIPADGENLEIKPQTTGIEINFKEN